MTDAVEYKQHLISLIQRQIRLDAGRAYKIDLEALDLNSLRELGRLISRLSAEAHAAVTRVRMESWL